MEGWWTIGVGWSQARVELGIDGHALEGTGDSLVEETEEDSADEDGHEEYDYTSPNTVMDTQSWSNEGEGDALENENENVSHEDEPVGEVSGKVELNAML